jgi:hypothetical protein
MTSDPFIQRLHDRFVEVSKRKEPVRLVAHLWEKILQCEEYRGDAVALERDSRFLAWYLVQQIKREKRMPGALRLKNLLQEDQYFADLAEAQSICPKQYALALKRSASPDEGAVATPMEAAESSGEDNVRAETTAGLRALREQLAGLGADEVEKLNAANAQKQLPGS